MERELKMKRKKDATRKVARVHAAKAYSGVQTQLYSFLQTRCYMEKEPTSRTSRFTPGKRATGKMEWEENKQVQRLRIWNATGEKEREGTELGRRQKHKKNKESDRQMDKEQR